MEDVLIVGSRTTGLMLAIELARRHVPVRIIDKSPGIDTHVRASLIHSRTLEILLGLGLADRATEGSVPEKGSRIYVNGELVGEALHAPIDSPFPFGMSQSQAKTEAVLEEHLSTLGVSVERGVELIALKQAGDRVIATLLGADGRETVAETSWLVGCDGAHSSVRHLTDTKFPGDPDSHSYVLADVVIEGELADGEGHVFFHDDGELFIFSTLPEGRRLIAANLPSGRELDRSPTLDEIQELVTTRGLASLRVRDPRWLTHFRIHYRLAPHYRQARVFLAGDAAHVHSLLAGQGMNTGMQDAFNLGWKLALVIQGHVPESWLDSYEFERRKVGQEVVAMTRAATEGAELFAGLSKADRERLVAHMFVPEAEKLAAARMLQEVDLDYRSSPLCLEPTDAFVDGPHAGMQAPDASPIVVDGKSTSFYESPASTRHRLLLFNGSGLDTISQSLVNAARQAVEAHDDWLDVIVVSNVTLEAEVPLPAGVRIIGDTIHTMHDRYGAKEACLYLLRPDGYVSYRTHRISGLRDYLDQVL